MKIHTDFSAFKKIANPVVTIGTFDGVHPGHLSIINRIREIANSIGGETVLLTFYPHPRMVLHPEDHGIKLLNTPEEKARLLEAAGIDHLIIYPFSETFSRLTAFDYVRDLLVNGIGAHTVVVGYDHRFGRNREGDHATLLELSEIFGFKVEEIPAKLIDTIQVSSTKIRNLISTGRMEEANHYLGYPYQFAGEVVHGNKMGRTIGFPTANLECNYPYKMLPGRGVYKVMADVFGTKYQAVLNIGIRPTVSGQAKQQTEVHILDFDQDLYGSMVTVEVHRKLRDEQKFGSIDELKAQIHLDIAESLRP